MFTIMYLYIIKFDKENCVYSKHTVYFIQPVTYIWEKYQLDLKRKTLFKKKIVSWVNK